MRVKGRRKQVSFLVNGAAKWRRRGAGEGKHLFISWREKQWNAEEKASACELSSGGRNGVAACAARRQWRQQSWRGGVREKHQARKNIVA